MKIKERFAQNEANVITYGALMCRAYLLCLAVMFGGCGHPTYIADEIPDSGHVSNPDTMPDTMPGVASECGMDVAPGDTLRTIRVGSNTREYLLHIPLTYSGNKSPLIIDFHALVGNGASQLTDSIYPPVTDGEGVVMAFPTGMQSALGEAWNIGACCVDANDVDFVRMMIDRIASVVCIDRKRIYAVGFSMGGGMSHYLACVATDIIAAVAPVAFDLVEENLADCQPTRPITVITSRGYNDPFVPYEGGNSNLFPNQPLTFIGAEATFDVWREKDGCVGEAVNVGNNCRAYLPDQCNGGVQVMLCTNQADLNQGNASMIWPVLKAHRLP